MTILNKFFFASVLLLPSVAFAEGLSEATIKALFKPLPKVAENPANPISDVKVALGKRLYLETRLSKNGKLSCNSCHSLSNFGVDNQPTSPGHDGRRGDRNSPTSFNAALHIAQFWDGRAPDVEAQALGPILNPIEMGMASDESVLAELKDDPSYMEAFIKAFPDEEQPLTYQNLGKAIGAFERTLLTPSPFDDYLNGKESALNASQKAGLKLFVETGCATCHNGVGIGGGMYQKIGLVMPYKTNDEGRYKVTLQEADKFFFKVPSLRNVEKTAPYFHDGAVATLEEAVQLMGKHQLGRDLTPEQRGSIIEFLKALTGKAPAL